MTYLERLRRDMLSVSCEFKVCVILFWKKENITVKLYRCAIHL